MAATIESRTSQTPPKSPAPELNGKQRRFLRGLAHGFQPILQIGKGGVSENLMKELDRAVVAHELVKIRALRECPTELDEIVALAEQRLGVSVVGTSGNVAILYRRHPKEPRIAVPGVAAPSKTKKRKKEAVETDGVSIKRSPKAGRPGTHAASSFSRGEDDGPASLEPHAPERRRRFADEPRATRGRFADEPHAPERRRRFADEPRATRGRFADEPRATRGRFADEPRVAARPYDDEPRPANTRGRAGATPRPSGKSFGDRPRATGKSFGDRPRAAGKSFGDKPRTAGKSFGDRPRAAGKSFGDRPRAAGKSFGDRPRATGKPYGKERFQSSNEDRFRDSTSPRKDSRRRRPE